MLRFNDIADRVLEYDPECDLTLLQRAYVFSAKVHDGQERLSGEPYLIHPLEVAGILAEMRLDAVTIAAGLLHDTVEDTLATVDELRDRFGDEVAFLVEGLTKLSKLEWKSAKERQAENFRKMLIAMSKDIRILLIKLADRLHNMRTLQFMAEDSRRRVAEETEGIYVPLAHRLGIDWVRRELADLAFRALQPEASGELEKKLRGSRKQRETYVEEVIGVLSAKLTAAGIQAELRGRPKELASIHHKMETQGITLDDIYDVIAFRIVLDGGREACYAALGIVHSTWPPVPGRFKDYVALPKPNGYQSLHTTVIGPYGERMEVQLRTQDMHRHAEFGIAAHWKYKDSGERSARDEAKFDWLRQLMERQQELDDPHEFLDVVKVDLFPDATFVFTPKGDVINLPKGATPVDFAYAIHSQVGERCQGARVNGKLVPLRHKLRDGDTVEIVTSAAQRPNKDWLDFVVSGKARSKIRHATRLAENSRARELGHGLLDREMRRAGLSLARALERGELDEVARVRARGAVDDLLAAVGYGRIPPAVVVRALKPEWEPEPDAEREKAVRGPKLLEMFRRPPKSSTTGIRVEGQGDVLVRFGNCCTPLPGDDVVGFVTRGRGVTVHQKDCRVVFHLDPQRRVDVEWESDAQVARKIKMKVVSRDEPGLLAKITKTISAAGINIGAARVSTHADRTATQSFDLWVSDVRTLASVMKEIQRIKGILSVERVRVSEAPLRILLLTSDWKWTGPAEPMLELGVGLRERGHTVDVACPEAPPTEERGVAIEARKRGIPPALEIGRGRGEWWLRDGADARRVRALVRERGYDVVHAYHTRDHALALRAAGWLPARRRARVVRSWRIGDALPREPWSRLLFGPGSDGVFCVAPGVAERCRAQRGGRPTRGWFGAVDLERFAPRPQDAAVRASLGLAPGDRAIGIVARVQPHRRFDLLLEAAAKLFARDPAARLLVIGRGTRREELAEAPARRLGIADRVLFAGYRSADYAEALRAIDVFTFLVPGSDGTCRALLEAAACGIPAVTTRRGALPEIVQDGETGLLADETPEALASAWGALLGDGDRRRTLGGAARKRAESHFTRARLASEVLALYREALA